MKNYFLTIFSFLIIVQNAFSQTDTLTVKDEIKVKNWNNLPYFMDDLMLIVGLNRGGIHFSNEFKDLSFASGYQIGVEGFLPLGNITFFDYGIHFSNRNFIHNPQDILFESYFLDLPIYVSFSLPELRSIDLRLLLGAQFSSRLGTRQSKPYVLNDPEMFYYIPSQFKNFDFGMTFGLSGEVGDFYGRLRGYVGANNFYSQEQGAYSAFSIEMGYFIFRRYRKY
ncbi:outer membrane beta-barrel protein [Pararhodonellum marinum]|uniref:outer membrane beta-barrel protein n=1 Tax=Pararhodonellum marinum TaxID=2755358 RepID=UPI00188ED6B2|nr:outer membrane beta-barrel protein [Pararhodonellum marinum]